ncbi:Catalase C [Stieleria magnilauensis]|uniref:catalase n=1 Tax=Stieleria magnilauensis TaxID=2527963 RepID=A0ABX5Y1J2_9BACT|nr:Catalase C [Planctomycetes bacterium TBK1r]
MAKKGNAVSGSKIGNGGELHQTVSGDGQRLTTNQGVVVSDDQNTLTVGPRGPQLLEDFILREKITHFDHERIPERVVHVRGYAAHGYFQAYKGNSKLTKAAFLQDPEAQTPVFCRFSTIAGSAGSPDLARDVRGPSVLFDCVVVAPAASQSATLVANADAIDWIRDAFGHLKVIGFNDAAKPMFEKASVAIDADEGVVDVSGGNFDAFTTAAKKHRIGDREC